MWCHGQALKEFESEEFAQAQVTGGAQAALALAAVQEALALDEARSAAAAREAAADALATVRANRRSSDTPQGI